MANGSPQSGRWYKFGSLAITDPPPHITDETYADVDKPTDYRQTCRVILTDNWVFIEVNRSDADGPRIDAYPAGRVVVLNLYDEDNPSWRP